MLSKSCPVFPFFELMNHELYMRRCFDLARLGAGNVSPNPMVGAVLVHEGRIIGEGWHQQVGEAHAEVNALASVHPDDRHLISKSTFYVSLQPCSIFGRTPPCTNLILKNKIPRVVISAIDQTPGVGEEGLDILRNAGVEVITGILKEEGEHLAKARNTFVTEKRPCVTLKFAQSRDGFLGIPGKQIWISNAYSKRLVHRLRSVSDAILVGTKTVLTDEPKLTNRLWYGKSPLRIFLDRNDKLPKEILQLEPPVRTVVVTEQEPSANQGEHLQFWQIPFDDDLLPKLLHRLFEENISSLIVEGGAITLEKFIEKNLWDEAVVFTGNHYLSAGLRAPVLPVNPTHERRIHDDILTFFRND